MKRMSHKPREDENLRHDEYGYIFREMEGHKFWDETHHYEVTLNQIENDIETPTNELISMCEHVVQLAVHNEQDLKNLNIPFTMWDLLRNSWFDNQPTLYGRMDFSYDGVNPAKLLEYNADTPTTLLESAVIQWVWLEDAISRGIIPKNSDQFNSIHEKLVERMKRIVKTRKIYFSGALTTDEDLCTLTYLAECAQQAGLENELIDIFDIGLLNDQFVDYSNKKIETMFKLYPWEWIWKDKFSYSPAMKNTKFIEPPWKMILSNKGMLALLWKYFPNHPNLLPTYFDTDINRTNLGANCVMKPLLSREGANVVLMENGKVIAANGGTYGNEPYVVQGLCKLPDFDGMKTLIGSWVVGDVACGMSIRETKSLITDNLSFFVPHIII